MFFLSAEYELIIPLLILFLHFDNDILLVGKYDYMTKEQDMQPQVVRVQEKGQVTIPQEIRKKLNLKKGDLVTFVESKEGVLIVPAEVVVTKALDEMGKALDETGLDLEEMIERGRNIRADLIDQEPQEPGHELNDPDLP